MESSAPTPVADLGRRAKAASPPLAPPSPAAKDEAPRAAADLLDQRGGAVLPAKPADAEAPAAAGWEAGPPNRRRLPEDAVILVDDVSHEAAVELMQLTGYVDCLIPRGGPSLVRSILDNAKVPYVIDGDGNCHVYVDAAADLDRALDIVLNAKTQRPSVCNAAESLLVHAAVADAFLPRAGAALRGAGVELVGDEAARRLVPGVGQATDDDFAREVLAPNVAVAAVPHPQAALAPGNALA